MQRIGLPENLKASCKLFLAGDVSGTTAYDISGNGNNGTLVNSPTTQRTQGYKGFVFNGSTQNIALPSNNDLKPTGPFSFSFYIRTSTTSTSYISIAQSYSQVSTVAGWEVMQNVSQNANPNSVRFVVGNNTGFTLGTQYIEAFGPSQVSDGKYHLIQCVYTGTQVIVYQDGVPGTPVNWGNGLAYTATSYQRIGCGNNSGTDLQFFPGIIINPMLFNKALTPTEIQQLYYSLYI